MSRHQKFYQGLKTGAYSKEDGDEDDYDYDDDYYDDDTADYVASARRAPAPKAGGKAAAKTPATPGGKAAVPTPASPKMDSEGILLSEVDYELVAPVAKKLRPIVGPKMLTATLVDIIRKANYDADEAMLAATEAAKPPAPKAATTTSPSTASMTPVTAGLGKGKKLVLGGGGSSNSGTVSPPPAVSPAKHADPVLGSSIDSHTFSPGVVATPSSVTPGMLSPVVSDSSAGGAMSPVGEVAFVNAPAAEVVADDGKQTITTVIAGHVDSGKSTILGHLLVLLGTFSERDVLKNERKGRETGKASFKYAWMLDQSEEERRRGVTIDAGAQSFSTEHKHVNVLDCPGHIDFVMNMITSATQADMAMLVVTAAAGEFESGLNYGTKEHLTILKTLGVSHILVVVNKMDAVDYSEDRFNEIVREMNLMLKQTRFKETEVMGFCPVSGLEGVNLLSADAGKLMPWYKGPSLVESIDQLTIVSRLASSSLRVTVQDVGKGSIIGRVESGALKVDDHIVFVPSGVRVKVKSLVSPGIGPLKRAVAGDPVELITTSDLTGLYQGCVGCMPKELCPYSTTFEAHIQTFASMAKVMLPGSQYIFACHSLSVLVTVVALVSKMDKTGKWGKGMIKCIPADTQAIVTFRSEHPLALEPAENCRALGRFVLRQEGETVGGGLVKRVL